MLSVGEDVEADALSKRGWTISAIARHLGRDRKTVRSYLSGERVPGVRRRSRPDALADYRAYAVARFDDDPHLWASALFDEVVGLGYAASYVSFARQVRLAGLRPHCECCSGVKGRETIEIDHPAGEEINGTGSSGAKRLGEIRFMCCWARCRIRAAPGECWPNRWTRLTSSRPWTQ